MSGAVAGRDLSYLRKLESCFLDLDNVTVLFNARFYRTSLFEFQLRYPEIRVFIDNDTLYLIPCRKALEKFKVMLYKRRARVEKRYEEITNEYNSIVSLCEAVKMYE